MPVGFEPTQPNDNRFTVCPSSPTLARHLKCGMKDLNLRPSSYQDATLPLS